MIAKRTTMAMFRYRSPLVVLVAMTAAITTIGVAPAAPAFGSYQGPFVDDPTANVRFQVERASGKRVVIFEVDNLAVTCDDGNVDRANLSPVKVPLRSHNVFRTVSYTNNEVFQTYLEVKGRLLGGGRAKGFVLYVADYLDFPSAPPGSGLPDCSTLGRRNWTAERVG
jgi:hypothetical protein